jgi:bidirectional [NiFe] hydrogenase diaphorase subunit
VNLLVDGVVVRAKQEANLLWVLLDNGFYVPNLCAIRRESPPLASCRLCFVEIEGKSAPVTACSQAVSYSMAVHLNTPRVQKVRNTAFELLLSHHHLDCHNCAKNKNCGLQDIAYNLRLKLKLQRLRRIPRQLPIDSSHSLFVYDPNKCVLCGKCIWICHKQGNGVLDFAFRGIATIVSTSAGIPLAETECNSCLECVAVCPVGALVAKPSVSLTEAKARVVHLI